MSEMIILPCWLFIASLLSHLIIAPKPNIMTEQNRKVYQGIRAIAAFEYKNTRSDFKRCHYWKKKLCQATGITAIQGEFSDKIPHEIDGFTDKRVVQRYVLLCCRKYLCRWFQINVQVISRYKWFQINFELKLI